ncbi:MAG: hypothetical protein JXB62_22300 [Pirellulales bacterium]|nr:hypothetical protein [Pirellulales bacterium]
MNDEQPIKGVRFRNGAWRIRHAGRELGSFETVGEANDAKRGLQRRLRDIKRGFPVPDNVVDVVRWIVSGEREGYAANGGPKPTTIEALVKEYLAFRKTRVENGEMKISSLKDDTWHLNKWVEWCESQKYNTVDAAVSEDALDQYKAKVVAHFGSKDSVRLTVGAVKACIEWGWGRRRISDSSLPRNLKSFREVKGKKTPKANPFTKDELHALVKAATPEMKLYILLACNAGYTQVDIATLDHSMVDWDTGMIERNRHKLEYKADIPQPSKLWPSTLALLSKHATKPNRQGGGLVLLSRQKTPLKDPERQVDLIQRAFHRLKQKVKIKGKKSFRNMRQVGASAIKNQYVPETRGTKTNQELFDMFLAHKPPAMNQPYDEGDFTELFQATEWLGEHLNLRDGDSLP